MTVTWAWVGAATHTGFTVRAKCSGASARLWYATNSELEDPVRTDFFAVVAGVVTLPITGLLPDTTYYWGVDDGSLNTTWQGQVRTHPQLGAPANFTFAASSCAGLDTNPDAPGQVIVDGVSNHPVFGSILAANPLMFCHLGDLHYRNIATGDEAAFRDAYDDVLTYNGTLGANARQGKLYRSTSLVYGWDDHDYGANNSDRNSGSRTAANQVYRERVPSYELADADEGIYHAFEIGRVLFILSDTRTFRSPNSQADDAGKTMLGGPQKEWMRQTLVASTAKLLVWLLPTPWTGTGSDKWDGFSTERDELAQMFEQTGWHGRMVAITGDRHALALDSGVNNPYGDFPQFMVGSLDSAGSGVDPQYQYFRAGNNQWGKFEVTDTGTRITFKGTGMIGAFAWQSLSYSFDVEDVPGPGPDPIPPPPSEARPTTDITWIACDLVTGLMIDELPDLSGTFSRVVGAYTSTSLSTPLVHSGPATRRNILGSCDPAQTMIAAIINDVPAWLGVILTRRRGSAATLELGLTSIEGYLMRRYINAPLGRYVDADQSSVIARNMLLHAGSILGAGSGIGMYIDAPASGVLRSWDKILPTDKKKVYEGMSALMAVDGGPEWTMTGRWTDANQIAIAKVAEVRARIGRAAEFPTAIFEASDPSAYGDDGPDVTYSYLESYAEGEGANYIVAYSSGEDETQPSSAPQLHPHLTLGRAIYEHHFQPDTSLMSNLRLDEDAAAMLARIGGGTNTLEITAKLNGIPRLGVDFDAGDDIGWNLTGPGHPDGWTGVARAIGWTVDTEARTIKPILWKPGEQL